MVIRLHRTNKSRLIGTTNKEILVWNKKNFVTIQVSFEIIFHVAKEYMCYGSVRITKKMEPLFPLKLTFLLWYKVSREILLKDIRHVIFPVLKD